MIVTTENYSTRPTILRPHQSIRDVDKVEHKQNDQNSGGGPGGKLHIEAGKDQGGAGNYSYTSNFSVGGQKRLEIGMPGGGTAPAGIRSQPEISGSTRQARNDDHGGLALASIVKDTGATRTVAK